MKSTFRRTCCAVYGVCSMTTTNCKYSFCVASQNTSSFPDDIPIIYYVVVQFPLFELNTVQLEVDRSQFFFSFGLLAPKTKPEPKQTPYFTPKPKPKLRCQTLDIAINVKNDLIMLTTGHCSVRKYRQTVACLFVNKVIG